MKKLVMIFVGLMFCLSAQATIFNVQVMDFQFQPSTLNILQGDTVRWIAVNGFHSVHNGCSPPVFGNSPTQAPWQYQWVATVPVGHYPYVCEVHPDLMQGVVHVRARGHWNVTVQNFSFTPQTLMISPGDTVIWHNILGLHSVTHTGVPSLFGFGPANAPWTYQFVFNLPPGPYQYICQIHPTLMQGVVMVVPPQSLGETVYNPIPIPSLPFSAFGATTGHCNDNDVACPDPGSQSPDVVYSYTPPQNMQVTISLCGSDFDTKLYVLNGTTLVGCNDNSCGQASEIQGLTLSSGVPYSIVIDGAGGASGNYALSVSQFVPCQGTAQVNTTGISFPPTNVGTTSNQTLLVTNTGTGNLCVSNVTTTGHIWTVSPTTFTLSSGQQQPVTVTFLPTFEHDFSGMIEIVSSDGAHPRDSVRVSGTGCKTAIAPPPPILRNAGSPSAAYFSMPWDQNGQKTEYAVEVSQNNFGTSWYLDVHPGTYPTKQYHQAGVWGTQGSGYMGGLLPNTAYQVRLWTRDCTGREVNGPAASITTATDIVMRDTTKLVISVVNSDTVQLNWNSALVDVNNLPVKNEGFAVYRGPRADSINEFLGQTSTGFMRVPTGTNTRAFFRVEPVLYDAYTGPKPFISWPPDGAHLTGNMFVDIQDLIHSDEWTSFTVTIDSANTQALVGSSLKNPWSYGGRESASTDFGRFPSGPHVITASVLYGNNQTVSDSIHVVIEPRTDATFTGSYDESHHMFSADTAGVQNLPNDVTDILWPISTVGERFGPHINFEWKPTFDSLNLLKPFIQRDSKVLSTDALWFYNPLENAAFVPTTTHPIWIWVYIACCCIDIDIATAGNVAGNYPVGGGPTPLGPVVSCNAATGDFEVGFGWEVTVIYHYYLSFIPANCYSGQDAKGDRTRTPIVCVHIPLDGTVEIPAGLTRTGHKNYGGTDYPAGGAGYGNDDYRHDNNGGYLDESNLIGGIVRWYDEPSSSGTLPKGTGMRLTANDHFLCRADPECPPIPPVLCCKEWDCAWDVTFCQNCSQTIQHTPPTFTGPAVPGACPALAGN